MAEQDQFYIDNRELFDNLPKPPDSPSADEPEGTPNTAPEVETTIISDEQFVEQEADNRVVETYKLSYNTNKLKFFDSEDSLIDMRESNNIITIDLRSIVYKPEPFSEIFDIRIKSY